MNTQSQKDPNPEQTPEEKAAAEPRSDSAGQEDQNPSNPSSGPDSGGPTDDDELVDEWTDESFPGSDPPANY